MARDTFLRRVSFSTVVALVLFTTVGWSVPFALASQNEIQTITATAVSGSVTVTVPATTLGSGGSATINPGDSASTVSSALAAVASIGSTSNIAVSGSTTAGGSQYAWEPVAGFSSTSVNVVNTSSGSTAHTVTVPSSPYAVALTPDGAYAYITSSPYGTMMQDDNPGDVSVVRISDYTVVDTITVGYNPLGIAMSPDGSKAYVTNYYGDSISVISTASNTVTSTYTLSGGSNPRGIAVSPSGSILYVVCSGASVVKVVNASSGTVAASAATGSFPYGIALTPSGGKAYISNQYDTSVSVLSTSGNTVTATIGVGSAPQRIGISADGSTVYVDNTSDSTISVISTASDAVTSTDAYSSHPYALYATSGGSSSGTYTLTFQGALANTDISQLTVSGTGWASATTQDGNNFAGGYGHLQGVSITPTDTKATASATYKIRFSLASGTALRAIKFEFSTTPSDTNGTGGVLGATAKPANMTIPANATPSSVTDESGGSNAAVTAFAGTTSANDTANGIVEYDLGHNNQQSVGSGNTFVFTISGFTNPAVGDCSATQSNTDTCYVRIIAYDNSLNVIDYAVGSWTVTSPITMSATIDPFMTFALAGVNASLSTYNAHLGTGTAMANTTGTAISFGSITVGAAKYAMQSLSIRTNASTGYWVYQKMTTGNNAVMGGTFGSNKIDPFDGGSSWGGVFQTVTPAAWAEPTGNVNVKSGWMAIRSDSDPTATGGQAAFATGIGSFGSGWVGPVVANGGTGGAIMHSAGPDNGTAVTKAYVTYKISVDAYQPADSYSGSMEYNVVATY